MPLDELERVPALSKAPGGIAESPDHAGGGNAVGLVVISTIMGNRGSRATIAVPR